eukprot:scaffold7211_cov247-Ochromonas_danica.AAC.7
MAEVEFVSPELYLDINDVAKYCESNNSEEKKNIICNKARRSICCYDGKVYFFDAATRAFKEVGDGKMKDDKVLKSLLESFVTNSMLIMANRPKSADPNAEDPSHRQARLALEMESTSKKYEKSIRELNNFTPKNIDSFKLKLSLPPNFAMDSDLNGIHFVNGRFDLTLTGLRHSFPSTFRTNLVPM